MIAKASFFKKTGFKCLSLTKKILKKSKLVRNLILIRRDKQGIYLKKRSVLSLFTLYSLLCFLLVDALGITYAHASDFYAKKSLSKDKNTSNSLLKNCSMSFYDLNHCKIEPLKNRFQISKAEAKEKESNLNENTVQNLKPSSSLKTAVLGTKQGMNESTILSEKHVLDPETLLNLSNTHRISLGLIPFEKNDKLCQIAAERSPEVYNEIFITGRFHEGFRARNLDHKIAENIIFNKTETGAFNWWLSSAVHKNTIEGSYKYSCVACTGNTCVQLFSNN